MFECLYDEHLYVCARLCTVSAVSENEFCQQLNLNLMETEIIVGNPPPCSLWFLNSTTQPSMCVLCLEVDKFNPVLYCCLFVLLFYYVQIVNINFVIVSIIRVHLLNIPRLCLLCLCSLLVLYVHVKILGMRAAQPTDWKLCLAAVLVCVMWCYQEGISVFALGAPGLTGKSARAHTHTPFLYFVLISSHTEIKLRAKR